MRKVAVLAGLIVILGLISGAQDYVHSTFQSKPWESGLWGGYGTGVGKASDWTFIEGGLRFGKVLTRECGGSILRGNLEFAGDAMPFVMRQPEIVQRRPNLFVRTNRTQTAYGAGINPFVLRWNFTRGREIAPFAGIDGGVLFTSKQMPQPDTSKVNFASGVEFGAHFFRRQGRAITLSGHVLHISNASLGNHNPGLNTTLHFRLGYTWFH